MRRLPSLVVPSANNTTGAPGAHCFSDPRVNGRDAGTPTAIDVNDALNGGNLLPHGMSADLFLRKETHGLERAEDRDIEPQETWLATISRFVWALNAPCRRTLTPRPAQISRLNRTGAHRPTRKLQIWAIRRGGPTAARNAVRATIRQASRSSVLAGSEPRPTRKAAKALIFALFAS